jgi:hypothetical protein
MSASNKYTDFHKDVKIEVVPGKGRGVIALRDFEVGELILNEQPLIKLPLVNSQSMAPVVKLFAEPQYSAMAADLSYSPNYARIKSEVPGLTDEQYSIMCAKISANSFGTAEYLALYYQCSLFNHNCAPNACQYHEESLEAKIYLIEPVRKGDEICISYRGDLLSLPTDRRKEWLRTAHGFDCDCTRCTKPDLFPNDALLKGVTGVPKNEADKTEAVQWMTRQYDALDPTSPHKDLALLKSPALRMKAIERYLATPFSEKYSGTQMNPVHWRVLTLQRDLIPLYMQHGLWTQAAEVLVRHISAENKVLPRYHHARLVNYVTLLHVIDQLSATQQSKYRDTVLVDWDNYAAIKKIYHA